MKKAFVYRVGEDPVVEMIDDSLHGMQSIVGGYIECIYPFEKPYILICNEEGKLDNLDPNRVVNGDVICGNFFVLKDGEDGEFADVDESDFAEIDSILMPYNGESTEPFFEIFSFGW
jgi:hypothetical protein